MDATDTKSPDAHTPDEHTPDEQQSPSHASSDDESTSSNPLSTRWRPQDIIYAFGPKNSFFISTTLEGYKYVSYQTNPAINSFDSADVYRMSAVALTPEGGHILVYTAARNGPVTSKGGTVISRHPGPDQKISSSDAGRWHEVQAQYEKLLLFLG